MLLWKTEFPAEKLLLKPCHTCQHTSRAVEVAHKHDRRAHFAREQGRPMGAAAEGRALRK